MLETGIKGQVEFIADESGSAKEMGSGALAVLATPKMIAMLEKAAWESVQPYLEDGCGTVGTLMNVTHDAATPLGMKVCCTSELVEVDGKKLVFKVEAFDEKGHIGGGMHERFIVNNEKFQAKTDGKRGA
jgi:predicted thioesterase